MKKKFKEYGVCGEFEGCCDAHNEERYTNHTKLLFMYLFIYNSSFKPNTEKYSFYQATQKRHRNTLI